MVSNKNKYKIDYFVSGPEREASMMETAALTETIHKDFDVFSGIRLFKGTFLLKIKDGTRPHQALPKYIEYALQEPFKELRLPAEATNYSTYWGRWNIRMVQ